MNTYTPELLHPFVGYPTLTCNGTESHRSQCVVKNPNLSLCAYNRPPGQGVIGSFCIFC